MILPRYRIADSTIPGAGRGLFLEEAVAPGRIVVAPDNIPGTQRWESIRARPDAAAAMAAAAGLTLPARVQVYDLGAARATQQLLASRPAQDVQTLRAEGAGPVHARHLMQLWLAARPLDVEVEMRERELREDPPRVKRVCGGRVLGRGWPSSLAGAA